jgi:protein-tyrosine-phosphatase/DNA-binding HxlR family transcriptional regulator
VSDIAARARVFAALGDPTRLAIAEELVRSDRSPSDLITMTGLSSALLAHHLDVLESAGIVERFPSRADGRKKFIRLTPAHRGLLARQHVKGRVVFVCTHNSARSQLAAALWTARTGFEGDSAGTLPSASIHPLAVEAATRVGLDLSSRRPRDLSAVSTSGATVITVCDQARHQLGSSRKVLHWSLPDPAERATAKTFDRTLEDLRERIDWIA